MAKKLKQAPKDTHAVKRVYYGDAAEVEGIKCLNCNDSRKRAENISDEEWSFVEWAFRQLHSGESIVMPGTLGKVA